MGDDLASIQLWSEVEFHPVGQGLFSSGSLHDSRITGSGFSWVYDCGTSSRKTILRKEIDSYALFCGASTANRPTLDLLVLSHFDKDHINGVVDLLSKFSVRMILLPYVPLSKRLILAFSEQVGLHQDLMKFFIDPVAYLTREGLLGPTSRIVFVRTGNPDELPKETPDEGEVFSEEPGENNPWEPGLPVDQLSDWHGNEEELEPLKNGHRFSNVGFLKLHGRIRVRGWWEFLPYNDARFATKLTATFLSAVSKYKSDLLQANSDPRRQQAIDALKLIYDREFGKSSVQRNQISLFLYTGPIGRLSAFPNACMRSIRTGILKSTYTISYGIKASKVGILYTGDGYLDKRDRLEALTKMLGPNRMENICVCQVMHHGSKSNWHQGVAAEFKPTFSIFSSDPNHKRLQHPHSHVLRDFWNYGPIQVDKNSGISIEWILQ